MDEIKKDNNGVEIKGLKTFAEQKNAKPATQGGARPPFRRRPQGPKAAKPVGVEGAASVGDTAEVKTPTPTRPRQNPPRQGNRPAGNQSPIGAVAQNTAKPAAQNVAKPAGNQNVAKPVAQNTAKPAGNQNPGKPTAHNQSRPAAQNKPVATLVVDQGDGAVKAPIRGGGKSLKIIPLGGLLEIGKNLTVVEYENDIIIVDCGMTFPNDDMLGVDLVIPDVTYLKRNQHKIRGVVITHGHEDHIGGLPYILRDLSFPIYCTGLAGGIIRNKLEEHRGIKKPKINIKKAGDTFKLGVFSIEMIHVNHSIADAVALAIRTPVGTCIFTGDFKIDTTPVDGQFINLTRFGELGNEGVLLLMSDSTNAERPGMAMSERKVGAALDLQFKNCDKRIILASFSSNVHRIQQVIDISHKYGRKVCISGRSMENMVKVATELGYLKVPANTVVDIAVMKKYPKDKMTVITTGSQGEPMSALMRMSMGSHKQIHISPEDKILIAASPIPGNEKSVYTLINELFKRGAEVIYDKLADIHVSGHACGEELKMILALTKPKYFMPVHGEYRHLVAHGNLAKQCGVPSENIFISEIGKVLELNNKAARFNGTVPSGKVLVDGIGVGDVGNSVLRDRQHLSQDGLVIIVTTFDSDSGTVMAGPDIIARGFTLTKNTTDISEDVRAVASEAVESCLERGLTDWPTIKTELRAKVSDYVYKKTKRSPMVLPINMKV